MLVKTSIGALAVVLVSAVPAVTNQTSIVTSTANEVEVELEQVIEKTWKCVGCTPAEDYTLSYLQDNTSITDKNALATILGNIRQESMFLPNICEGGARVPYHQCYRGGFGLIQWTTQARYDGLGSFCNKYGCDPSSLEGQVRYMVNEAGFQNNLPHFERVVLTINS